MHSIAPESVEKTNKNEDFPIVLRKGGIVVPVYLSVSKDGYNQCTVSYYQNGQRMREVLGDEKEARARAKSVHEALVKGEEEAAGMKLQDIKAYTNALRLLESTGISLETACLEYAKAFQALKGRASVVHAAEDYMSRHDGVIEGKTVAEVVKELLEAKEKGVSQQRRDGSAPWGNFVARDRKAWEWIGGPGVLYPPVDPVYRGYDLAPPLDGHSSPWTR